MGIPVDTEHLGACVSCGNFFEMKIQNHAYCIIGIIKKRHVNEVQCYY